MHLKLIYFLRRINMIYTTNIFLIIALFLLPLQSAPLTIHFKNKPSINITTIKNCASSIARAAFYSALVNTIIYLGPDSEIFTKDHHWTLALGIFAFSIGCDVGKCVGELVTKQLFSLPETNQPQSPSSIIYSAAP